MTRCIKPSYFILEQSVYVKVDVQDSLHTFCFSSALHFGINISLRAENNASLKVRATHDSCSIWQKNKLPLLWYRKISHLNESFI